MWIVRRNHSYYGIGEICFETREEAERFLQSEEVQLDKQDGFYFTLIEK